jgi:hypothetical protein
MEMSVSETDENLPVSQTRVTIAFRNDYFVHHSSREGLEV